MPRLNEVLDQLFDKLNDAGALKGLNVNRDNLLKNVQEIIGADFDLYKVKNDPAIYKIFMMTILSEAIGNRNPQDKLNLSRDPAILKKELKEQIIKMLKKLSFLPEEKLSEKKIEEIAEKLSNKLTAEILKNPTPEPGKKQNTEEKRIYDEMLSGCLRNLYAGNDPTQVGEIVSVVVVELGNAIGAIFTGTVDYEKQSTMDDASRYDPNKPNNSGDELFSMINAIAAGTVEEVNRYDDHMKPKYPGQQHS